MRSSSTYVVESSRRGRLEVRVEVVEGLGHRGVRASSCVEAGPGAGPLRSAGRVVGQAGDGDGVGVGTDGPAPSVAGTCRWGLAPLSGIGVGLEPSSRRGSGKSAKSSSKASVSIVSSAIRRSASYVSRSW